MLADVDNLVSELIFKKFPESEMLDVTLRDGGFINNFSWSERFINEFVKNSVEYGINSIEIGYVGGVSSSSGWYEGPASDIQPGLIFDIMNNSPTANLYGIINPWRMKSLSRLPDLYLAGLKDIRVAYNEKHADTVWGVVEEVKNLGFNVCLNISSISRVNNKKLSDVLLKSIELEIGSIFFADTSSSLYPDEIHDLYRYAKSIVREKAKLGLHGHDFKGFGMGGAYMAAKGGADVIDMSVCGAGRGGGNVRTEFWAASRFLSANELSLNVTALLSNITLVCTELNVGQFSLLPVITSTLGIGPEKLEIFYQNSSISEQNELAISLVSSIKNN